MTRKEPNKIQRTLSSLLMLLMLSWLTVCLPYVAEGSEMVEQLQLGEEQTPDADESNPLGSTTEEKSEGGLSLVPAFLPGTYHLYQHSFPIVCLYKCHPSNLYKAYHPERIIPPPEA